MEGSDADRLENPAGKGGSRVDYIDDSEDCGVDLVPRRGNCYVTSEALYHLLGGKAAGWKPMRMPVDGESHWFLQHSSGLILDATAKQFGRHKPAYSQARGNGFLTLGPSRRARELMTKLVWQNV